MADVAETPTAPHLPREEMQSYSDFHAEQLAAARAAGHVLCVDGLYYPPPLVMSGLRVYRRADDRHEFVAVTLLNGRRTVAQWISFTGGHRSALLECRRGRGCDNLGDVDFETLLLAAAERWAGVR